MATLENSEELRQMRTAVNEKLIETGERERYDLI
jgi:hypothetical protein